MASAGRCVLLLAASLLLMFDDVSSTDKTDHVVDIDSKSITFTVDQRFLSVGLDSSIIVHDLRNVQQFKSPELFALCDGLRQAGEPSEVMLRIGGGNGDDVIYKPDGLDVLLEDGSTLYVLNNTEWDEINAFVEKLQWRIVFGLNLLLRQEDGSWDPSNAIALIRYTQSKGYDVQFELGNEPDLYFEYRKNSTVSPTQLAADFKHLHEILQQETGGRSSLYGPDVATLTRFNVFPKFIQTVEPGVLDAVTYHHYYGDSKSATVDDFTDPAYQDKLMAHINQATALIKQGNGTKDVPMWIGETGSTYGGGAKGLSDTYAAGFLWIDQLGLAARMGVSLLFRWTLVGGRYAMIQFHKKTYTPLPDYWLSLLHKDLVGKRVLEVKDGLAKGRSVRTYAHCVYRENTRGYPATAITVLALNNQHNASAVISFGAAFQGLQVDEYILSPVDGDLTSQEVMLNGNVLRVVNTTVFPVMKPITRSQPVVLPPRTFGFFVIPQANAPACRYND